MKVLVTYDFLATSPFLGKTLSNTLSFIQKVLYPLHIEVVIDNGNFKQEAFYDLILVKEENRKKFIVLDEKKLTKNSLGMINDYIKEYDLLITYELSIETRELFDKCGIKYIDLWLSPMRFYDDLMFNIYSNVPNIQNSLKKYGKIDSIINCAAILTKKELVEMSFKEISKEISINFLGAVNIAKTSYKYLKQTKGSLILFTSSSYTRGRAGYSLYSSTKAAIVNLTQALASEWQKDNIRVNVICPERTKTPMRKGNFGKEDDLTLLTSEIVAQNTIQAILAGFNGLVVDVKRGIN